MTTGLGQVQVSSPELVTRKEVSNILGVDRFTVNRWIREEIIVPVEITKSGMPLFEKGLIVRLAEFIRIQPEEQEEQP